MAKAGALREERVGDGTGELRMVSEQEERGWGIVMAALQNCCFVGGVN